MTETKHTPGPWAHDEALTNAILIMASGEEIASVYYEGRNVSDQMRADARLIAAAPELLETLYELVSANSGLDGERVIAALQNARAAISKATGAE